MISAEETG